MATKKVAKRTKASESFTFKRGALAGMTGTLVDVQPPHHLKLSVNLLRRSVLVEVSLDDVTRVGSSGKKA